MTKRKVVVKRRPNADTALRRQRILDAAAAMICERGYEPVSTTEIGAMAGVSGPALYRHFTNKAEILAVLCNQTVDRLIEFVGPRRGDPNDELAALVAGQIQLVIQYPMMVRVFEDEERSLPADLRRQVRQREREHAQRWIDALRLLDPKASARDVEGLVYATVGMILSVPRWPKSLRAQLGLEDLLLAAATRLLADFRAGKDKSRAKRA